MPASEMDDMAPMSPDSKRKRREEPPTSPNAFNSPMNPWNSSSLQTREVTPPRFPPRLPPLTPPHHAYHGDPPGPGSPTSSFAQRFGALDLDARDRGFAQGADMGAESAKRQKTSEASQDDGCLAWRIDVQNRLNEIQQKGQHKEQQQQQQQQQNDGSMVAFSGLDLNDTKIFNASSKVTLSPQDGNLHRIYPSINRLWDSKSRVSKRFCTSPRRASKSQSSAKAKSESMEGVESQEPDRAALTWKEYEITIYDPNDKDDDGLGMNGIGFRPSASVAQLRSLKRRQQVADYRKREESEARALRSSRRQGPVRPEKGPSPRRVRFIDADNQEITVKGDSS